MTYYSHSWTCVWEGLRSPARILETALLVNVPWPYSKNPRKALAQERNSMGIRWMPGDICCKLYWPQRTPGLHLQEFKAESRPVGMSSARAQEGPGHVPGLKVSGRIQEAANVLFLLHWCFSISHSSFHSLKLNGKYLWVRIKQQKRIYNWMNCVRIQK